MKYEQIKTNVEAMQLRSSTSGDIIDFLSLLYVSKSFAHVGTNSVTIDGYLPSGKRIVVCEGEYACKFEDGFVEIVNEENFLRRFKETN